MVNIGAVLLQYDEDHLAASAFRQVPRKPVIPIPKAQLLNLDVWNGR